MNRITFADDYNAPFADELEDGPQVLTPEQEVALRADLEFGDDCPFCEDACTCSGRPVLVPYVPEPGPSIWDTLCPFCVVPAAGHTCP